MNRPTRLAAALSMALMLTAGGGALVGRAADTPEGAVVAVIDALMAKDFAGIAPLICEERRAEVAAEMDLGASFSGAGFDPQIVIDAMTLAIEGPQVTLVSNDGTTAVVHLTGTMSMAIALDEETIRSLVVAMLESAGMEVTDETLAQYLPIMVESLNQSFTEPVDVDVTVVNEDGAWLMCDSFDEEPAASGSPAPSPVASDAPAV